MNVKWQRLAFENKMKNSDTSREQAQNRQRAPYKRIGNGTTPILATCISINVFSIFQIKFLTGDEGINSCHNQIYGTSSKIGTIIVDSQVSLVGKKKLKGKNPHDMVLLATLHCGLCNVTLDE